MLDKSLMKIGFMFRYTERERTKTSEDDIILIVSSIRSRESGSCDYKRLDHEGIYGHNEFSTFDRFNKMNTIRNDLV